MANAGADVNCKSVSAGLCPQLYVVILKGQSGCSILKVAAKFFYFLLVIMKQQMLRYSDWLHRNIMQLSYL